MRASEPTWQSEDGRVQLWHGDCLKILPHVSNVDAVVTDPPYSSLDVAVTTGTTTRLVRLDSFAGKRLSSSTGKRWFNTIPAGDLPSVFLLLRTTLKETGALYVFSDVKSGLDYFPSLSPANVIVWDKKKIGMGYSWRRMHEWIAFCPMSRHTLRDKGLGDIIRWPTVQNKEHPTEKPPEVVKPLLLNSTDENDTVLDPFMGSGTTGIACIRTGRRFIGIEIDEHYFVVARNRIERELRQQLLPL